MASSKKYKKKQQPKEEILWKSKSEETPKKGLLDSSNYKWMVGIFAVVLYLGTLGHGYVYDDEIVIQKNIHVQNGINGIGDIWTKNYLHGVQGFNDGLYRPFSPTMFAFEIELFGQDPWIGHFMNVLMYGIVCILVFLFVKKLTRGNDVLALIAGLLYAAHPIHTEVVANIKSRDELMAALFGFAALYYTLKHETLTFQNIAIVGGLFLLSLFSKESAIAFAVVIPLTHWFYHRNTGNAFKTLAIVMAAIAIPWYMLHEAIIKSMEADVDDGLFSAMSNAVLMAESKIDQMATGLLITVTYLYKTIIPYPLVNDYSPNAIVAIRMASATGMFCLLLLSAVFFGGAYLMYRKRNMAGLGILMFFILLAPVANIFLPIGTTMGERMAFAPSLGIVLVLVALYDYLKLEPKKYILGGLVLVFGFLTVSRAAKWESNLILYSADVVSQPESFRTHYNYATALNKSVAERTKDQLTPTDRDRLLLSIEHFTKALEIKPDYADGILNLGNAHRRLGNTDKARELYNELIRLKPDYTKAVFNLAVTSYEEKDYATAHTLFISYLDINGPQKGMAWYSAGVCSGYLGDFPSAIKELNNSLAIDNSKWDAWNYLGMAYGNSGQWDKAIGAFQQAYKLGGAEDVKRNLENAQRALAEQSAQ